jgi:uncharacterized membrane protein
MVALPRPRSRHWNFYLAFGGGIALLILGWIPLKVLSAVSAAIFFSIIYLYLTARDLPKLTPAYLRQHAGDEDAPPLVVFLLTLAVVAYVVTSLFMVINAGSIDPLRLSLGIASVVLSWLMITTMWGMHYAWEFYEAPADGSDKEQRGGLSFPGDELPDGSAFIYFSLVVAMTAQTSDTDVSDNRMRRIVSGPSFFGYVFNTVIIAAAINIVVSLGGH